MIYNALVEVECDNCHETQEFDLDYLGDGRFDLLSAMLRAGWVVLNGEETCPTCENMKDYEE